MENTELCRSHSEIIPCHVPTEGKIATTESVDASHCPWSPHWNNCISGMYEYTNQLISYNRFSKYANQFFCLYGNLCINYWNRGLNFTLNQGLEVTWDGPWLGAGGYVRRAATWDGRQRGTGGEVGRTVTWDKRWWLTNDDVGRAVTRDWRWRRTGNDVGRTVTWDERAWGTGDHVE